MAIIIGFSLYLLSVCAYAIWRGGAPERLGALAVLVASGTTIVATLGRENHFEVFEPEVFLVDAALLAALLALALKANRYWPIFATSCHLVTVAVHLAKASNPALVAPVYAFASTGMSLAVLLVLWLGTMRHRQRLSRYGSDPSWRAI